MGRGSKHGIDRHEWQVRAREFCRRGKDLSHSKLTEDLVREIRATKGQIINREWAARLGVSRRSIERVRAYETWIHVR